MMLSISTIDSICLNDGAAQRIFPSQAGWDPGALRKTTMTIRTLTSAAFTVATLAVVSAAGPATAGDRIDFTPPLYRMEARPTAAVRPASEITTTPSLVRGAPETPRRLIEATAR